MLKLLLILFIIFGLVVGGGGYLVYANFISPKLVSENSEVVLTCSDTDGYDIYIKGHANFERDEPGESSFYESPDFCESHPKAGTVLREGWCEGNIYKEVRITCGIGRSCVDGACV